MLDPEPACARCGRLTPEDDMRLWTTRERLRQFTPRAAVQVRRVAVSAEGAEGWLQAAPAAEEPASGRPAFSYRWITVAHALCADCHGVVEADPARFHDHDRRRAWVVLIAFVGLAALIWAGFAPFAHQWMAAFWRNGAGGR